MQVVKAECTCPNGNSKCSHMAASLLYAIYFGSKTSGEC